MWNVYLHPDINTSEWTDEENKTIKLLARRHNAQNWDLIASELNTNRSGYLVFYQYHSTLRQKFRNERFQVSEDEFLLEVVDKCSIGNFIPWRKVASFFQDRSKQQLYHRYKYYLSHGNVVKGTFTEAEDILIVYLVGKFGRDYSRCATYLSTRTSVQIRNRYTGYLDKLFVNLGQYSKAEDLRILDHVRVHGTKDWKTLSVELKRGRSHVRQRYLTLQKWLQMPSHMVKNLQSRKLQVRSKQTKERYKRLHDIIEELNSYNGEVNLDVVHSFIKKVDEQYSTLKPWRLMKKSSFVDNQLIGFFKGTCNIQREYKTHNEQSILVSATRVVQMLDLFEIPSNSVQILPNLSERDLLVMNVLMGTTERKPSFESFTPQIRFRLPPTLNTMLGLRGIIVKSEMIRNFYYTIRSVVAEIIENDLQKPDAKRTCNILAQRRNFFVRFYTLFNWPSIISKSFPDKLKKAESDGFEIESPQKIRGRPKKVENPKIAKMLDAKKRKRLGGAEKTSAVVPSTSTHDDQYFDTEKNEFVPVTGFRTISAEDLERIKQNTKVVILDNPMPTLKIVKVALVNQK